MCFRYILLHLSDIEAETQGKLCFEALFTSFLGVYTYQATLIGLFVLKFDTHEKAHNLGQLTVLLFTLFACTQYHIWLKRLYGPLIQHQEGTTNGATREDTHSEELRRLSPVPDPSDPLNPESYEKSRNNFDVTIWLPRDSLDIVRSLIHEVRCKCFSTSATVIRITDCTAGITDEGQITFQEDSGSGTELLETQRSQTASHISGKGNN